MFMNPSVRTGHIGPVAIGHEGGTGDCAGRAPCRPTTGNTVSMPGRAQDGSQPLLKILQLYTVSIQKWYDAASAPSHR